MRTLLLTSLLILFVQAAPAQTPPEPTISDKNIRDCFKHTLKMPSDFDRCVAEEFQRVKEEKQYRELRIRAGKDPYGGCGKKGAYKECFDEVMTDMRKTTERLYDGSSAADYYDYLPRIPSYRFYYPYRYFPRTYPRFQFIYPRRFGTTYRHWRY